jgi:hypothetical protein
MINYLHPTSIRSLPYSSASIISVLLLCLLRTTQKKKMPKVRESQLATKIKRRLAPRCDKLMIIRKTLRKERASFMYKRRDGKDNMLMSNAQFVYH